MSVLLFFTFALGLWVILKMLRLSKSNTNTRQYTSALLQDRPAPKFEFPEHDETGHKIIRISTLTFTGAIYPHFGYNPQTTIPRLKIGEQVFLRIEPDNQYDNSAVSVHDMRWRFIGWIPKERNRDIFKRLEQGQTVLAKVTELGSYTPHKYYDYYNNYNENPYDQYLKILTCTIEVSIYSS